MAKLSTTDEQFAAALAYYSAMRQASAEGVQSPSAALSPLIPGGYDQFDAGNEANPTLGIAANTGKNGLVMGAAAMIAALQPPPPRRIRDVCGFLNGFTEYATFGAPCLWRDVFGTVWLDGEINDDATAGSGNDLFQLPGDCRPNRTLVFPIWCSGVGAITITPDGMVRWESGTGPDISLNGIFFRATTL
jgi:hypothetical protein